ncbi:hypothetical protein [Streptomyces canus]|uniref:hypothetical protein n=1 Tax=Streptomyces canus TaxID=58343 RepID=UPI00278B22A2|nr:hypothetical protein [Streptomyces canus]MDQ0766654.1 hypothetical protein [Streptomyces canus]
MNGAFEMADDASGREPTQASRIGPCGALFLYSLAAGLCMSGPVLLIVAGFTGSAAGLLLAGVLCTVLCAPLGVVLWASTDNEREYNRRLDTVGVAATAEVTELTYWDDGEQAGVTVGLRISGPGCPTFEATCKRSKPPALRVGLRLPAVVDPSDHLFRIDF